MRPLRVAGLVAFFGGGLLAVGSIVYAGHVRLDLLPSALAQGDEGPLFLMRLAWMAALAGMAAALAGTLILPRTAE